jgi:hypothetical protein
MGFRIPKEADQYAIILDVLRLRGVVADRINPLVAQVGGGAWLRAFRHWRGISDIIGVLPGGKALFIEVKRPGEKPKPHQREFLDLMRGQGALCLVVNDSFDVEKYLEAEGY